MWIPPLALVATYGTEKYIQTALSRVVDRGHPPTTLGTYPSGGCARLLAVWGVSLVLISLTVNGSQKLPLWRHLGSRSCRNAPVGEGAWRWDVEDANGS